MPGWLGFGVTEVWLPAWYHFAKIFCSYEVTWTSVLAIATDSRVNSVGVQYCFYGNVLL